MINKVPTLFESDCELWCMSYGFSAAQNLQLNILSKSLWVHLPIPTKVTGSIKCLFPTNTQSWQPYAHYRHVQRAHHWHPCIPGNQLFIMCTLLCMSVTCIKHIHIMYKKVICYKIVTYTNIPSFIMLISPSEYCTRNSYISLKFTQNYD